MSECTCDNLPSDHPDWMKGMCLYCYDQWAITMRWAFKDKRGDNGENEA